MKRTGHKGTSLGGATSEHRVKRGSIHEPNVPEEDGMANASTKHALDDLSSRNTSDLFRKPLGAAPTALDGQQERLVGPRSKSDAAGKRALSRSNECLSESATPPVEPTGMAVFPSSPLAKQAPGTSRLEAGFFEAVGAGVQSDSSTVGPKQSRPQQSDSAVVLASPTSSPRLSAPHARSDSTATSGANAASRAASLPSDSLHAVVPPHPAGGGSATAAISPLVTSSSPSHTVAAGQQLPHTLCRVHLPDGSSSVISIQQPSAAGSPDGSFPPASVTPVGGATTAASSGSNARVNVYDALRPLCERRGIDLSHCEILFCGTEKVHIFLFCTRYSSLAFHS